MPAPAPTTTEETEDWREAPSLCENYAQCRVSRAEDDNAEDEEMTPDLENIE